MLAKLSIEDFLAKLADRPAPGSGSAAALIGAAGIGVLQMAAGFSQGNSQILAREIAALEQLRQQLTELIERDAAVLARALPALMTIGPGGASEEWNDILQQAIAVPTAIADACLVGMELAQKILALAPPNVHCDLKFALLSCHAAVQGALLLAKLNISLLRDDQELALTLSDHSSKIGEIANAIMQQTINKPASYE